MKRALVILGGVVAATVVVAVGAWLALSGNGSDGDGSLEAFCRTAGSYFDASAVLPDTPEGVREFVDGRVSAAADMARKAPEVIRSTAVAHSSDLGAARKVFEKHGYSPGLVNDALNGTLDPPGDVASVLRVMGYSYSGDAAGTRAGELASFGDRNCPLGSGR